MSNQGKKPPSQRQLQVGEEIRQTLSAILLRGEFYDPETRHSLSVTVSEVSVSPDLHNAMIYVMPLAGKDADRTLQVLKRLAPKLRSMVASRMKMRHIPAFQFRIDTTFDRVSALDEIFNRPEVKRDIEKPGDEYAAE